MGGKISYALDAGRSGEVKEVEEVKERTGRLIGEILAEGEVDLTQRAQRKSTECSEKNRK
jgi:hypothetical protein